MARVKSAVDRSRLDRIPILCRRWLIWLLPRGCPVHPPGKCQGDVVWGADLGLVAAGRDGLADQAGQQCRGTTGELPNVIVTVSPSMGTSSTVSWLLAAIFCA